MSYCPNLGQLYMKKMWKIAKMAIFGYKTLGHLLNFWPFLKKSIFLMFSHPHSTKKIVALMIWEKSQISPHPIIGPTWRSYTMSHISLFKVKLGLFWPFLWPGGVLKPILEYWNTGIMLWYTCFNYMHPFIAIGNVLRPPEYSIAG